MTMTTDVSAFKSVKQFLEKRIGLSSTAVSKKHIEQAVEDRLKISRSKTVLDYYHKLLVSPQEVQELIELLIVPETWFFRDKGSFEFLSNYVYNEWQILKDGNPLRVLCVPCSTGEESYSISITLLEAGLAPDKFYIDALDISKKNLIKAETALYTKNSFRSKEDVRLRNRYFEKLTEGYLLNRLVRNTVHYMHGNIVEPNFLSNKARYDIIFCRNLMIYLSKRAQKRVLANVSRLLKPRGIVITSPAETDLFRLAGFVSENYPMANAFRNPSSVEKQEEPPKQVDDLFEHTPLVSSEIQLVTREKEIEPVSLLEQASVLADKGELPEAHKICLEYIQNHQTDSKGYFLLGLLQYAEGQEELAFASLQKAIYLDPGHYEALIYLALLAEKRSDFEQAALLRTRAKKAMNKRKILQRIEA